MVKYSNGVKKGAWSEDEDNKLKAYIQRYGHWNWGLLPKFAGVSRSGRSCRLRWLNYLRPNMKHGNFTKEEDDLLIDLHNKLGNKWSSMAAKFPGRSDNELKNRWNIHFKKRAQNDHTVSSNEHFETLLAGVSSSDSLLCHGSDCAVLSDFTPQTLDDELVGNFWTEPFLPDNDTMTPSGDDLLSPFSFFNEFTAQSSFKDLFMTDECLWSMMDSNIC